MNNSLATMTAPSAPVVVIGAGQSGLAAARAVRDSGLRPVVLEARDRPAGSWPDYYDSLALFSPVRFSSMPGSAFPGEPDHYPTRDEVAAYLQRYAESLDVEIRTRTRVQSVSAADAGRFTVTTTDGDAILAAAIVAASGTFGNPHIPAIPGDEGFTGRVLHSADYRNPKQYAGERIVVVGGGNSAVQIGFELAEVASVSLATRQPLQFVAQRPDGRDLHYWLDSSGFDDLPPAWLAQIVQRAFVLDTGRYAEALATGRLDRRPMFTAFDGDQIVWADGTRERVDTVLFATGYRPSLDFLRPLGALEDGLPRHDSGISTSHRGLVYVGLEFQRSFSSNTLRGVSRDADHVARAVAAHVQDAAAVLAS